MSEFFKYCFEHWTQLSVIVALIIIAIVATYKVTTKYHHWTSKITMAEIDCSKIDGHIVPRLSTIDTNISNLGNSFDSLLVYLKSKDVKLDARLIKAFSPIDLTDLGKKILEDIGGKDFVDTHETELIKSLTDKIPKTALDVQNYAPAIIHAISNSSDFNSIKNYLFKNPNYKYVDEKSVEFDIPIDISGVVYLMGIYLRNKYLTIHPNLKD